MKEEILKEFENTFIDWNSPRHMADGHDMKMLGKWLSQAIDKAIEFGREEEENKFNKIKCWYVMYRGNGYGLFLSKEIAEDFAKFIPARNEEKLENGGRLGQYQPHIYSGNLIDLINRSEKLIKSISNKRSE